MDKLTQRQIIGEFYKTLEQDIGNTWVPSLSNYFTSDQAQEEYAWLGMSPALRQWIGGRNAKGFRDSSIIIKNLHYEATVDFLVRDLRRDKSGQALVRIREMAQRANAHWASLLSTLIAAGEAAVCYDGQYFFDTDHSEESSGTQSNDIQVDISAVPASVHGSTTAPSVEEMDAAISAGIAAIGGFKDNQGEPMNENATGFLVMVPTTLYNAALKAVTIQPPAGYPQSMLQSYMSKFSITVEPNVRLNATWTAAFPIFRTDTAVKALIRQEETGVQLKVKGEGSEYEFDNDAHQYGIDTWRNVGYGYWQNACLVTLI